MLRVNRTELMEMIKKEVDRKTNLLTRHIDLNRRRIQQLEVQVKRLDKEKL